MGQTEGACRYRGRIVMVTVIGLAGMVMLGPWRASADVAAHDAMVKSSGAVEREEVGVSRSPATSEHCSEAEQYPYGEPQVEPLWKLGRGIQNLALGMPAELIRNPVIEVLKADTVFGVGAGLVEGTLVGIGKGFWRMGAGFLDIVTFPATLDPWYDPELLPKYPF